MKKNFNTSPLPFQGQKRRFVKHFKEALNNYPEQATYVDLFGGSGLLSHTVKQKYPNATVIWNDYDDFRTRINAIPQTNELLSSIRALLKDAPRKVRIAPELKGKILEVVKVHLMTYNYVDFVSLSASLLFSMKYVTSFDQLYTETLYNKIRLSDFEANGYLEGVQRVQDDYKVLYEQHKSDNTIFLVDPPYLSTDTTTYSNEDYWKLKDYLDVLSVLDGSSYFYFTSNKSNIVELCEWIETRTVTGNPFAGSTVTTTSNQLNYNSSYTDIMLYK